jgi:hypothetical protein
MIRVCLNKYAPALDNYGQSCFVRSDFSKMKCVCKTQMMPPPDHKKLKTSFHYVASKKEMKSNYLSEVVIILSLNGYTILNQSFSQWTPLILMLGLSISRCIYMYCRFVIFNFIVLNIIV